MATFGRRPRHRFPFFFFTNSTRLSLLASRFVRHSHSSNFVEVKSVKIPTPTAPRVVHASCVSRRLIRDISYAIPPRQTLRSHPPSVTSTCEMDDSTQATTLRRPASGHQCAVSHRPPRVRAATAVTAHSNAHGALGRCRTEAGRSSSDAAASQLDPSHCPGRGLAGAADWTFGVNPPRTVIIVNIAARQPSVHGR